MHDEPDLGTAITTLEKRLVLASGDEHLVLDLASLLLRAGRPQDALAVTKSHIRQHPQHSANTRRWLTTSALCDWPAYRASPQHHAHSPALALRTRPTKPRWTWTPRHPDQAFCFAPVAAAGVALVVHTDRETLGGFDPCVARLACIDLQTGALRWLQKRTCIPAAPLLDLAHGLAIWSWLARDDQGRVIPEFVGIHIQSGEVAWFKRGDAIAGYAPYDISPLLLIRDRLVAASNGYRPGFRPDGGFLCVLDAASGQLREQLALSGARTPAATAEGEVIFYNDDEHFYQLPFDGITPNLISHDPLSALLNISAPLIHGPNAWVLSEGERGAHLWRLSGARRHLVWQFASDGSFAHAPCLDERRGLLFVATGANRESGGWLMGEGHLFAVDLETGETQQHRAEPWRPVSSPVLVEDVLFVCGELMQRPAGVGALGEQLPPDLIGQVNWGVGGEPGGMDGEGDGSDYFNPAATQRSLSAFDTRSGSLEPLWRLPLPDHLSATIEPVPVGDMLLVQLGAGQLVALSED
jgi:hypothetical protein